MESVKAFFTVKGHMGIFCYLGKNKDWICLFSYVKNKKWDELYDFLQCCKNDKDWKKYIIDFMKNYTWDIYTTISKIK